MLWVLRNWEWYLTGVLFVQVHQDPIFREQLIATQSGKLIWMRRHPESCLFTK